MCQFKARNMSTTTFVQYRFCSLCRMSCKKLKKHIHSPKHQEIVKNILTKFMKKISDARSHLKHPVTRDVLWNEAERKIWCYFCSCDVTLHLPKTTISGDCVLVSAGFLGHMTRKDHSENTAKFLKDNSVDMTRTPEFLIDKETFLKFLEQSEKAAINYLNEKHKIMQKAANVIRFQDRVRHQTVTQGLLEQNLQRSRNISSGRSHEAEDDASLASKMAETDYQEYERKKTAQAFGHGLTAIERLNEDDSEGNIHSNAIPPWLRKNDDDERDGEAVIGPSITDWNNHKKAEEKRKLPLCRVGAKFDHQSSQGDEWLPNYGGVWSHGARTKAGTHFKKRFNSSRSNKKLEDGNKPATSKSYSSSTSFHQHNASSTSSTKPKTNSGSRYSSQLIGQDNSRHLPSSTLNSTSTSTSNHHDFSQFGNFNGFKEYDASYASSPPSTSTTNKTVRPYISKRRKADHHSQSCGDTYSSNDSQHHFQFQSKESVSFQSSNSSTQQSSSYHSQSFMIHQTTQNMSPHTAVPSIIRLLPTPVLTAKK